MKSRWVAASALSLIVLMVVIIVWLASLTETVSGLIVLDRTFPRLISCKALARNLQSRDNLLVAESLSMLADKGEPCAIAKSLQLLESSDPYIWLNAARYLAACHRQESVPYLIKALRHKAWRSHGEILSRLHDLTGLEFGFDFKRWQQWWFEEHPTSTIDFDTALGPGVRTEKETSAEPAVAK